MSMEKFKQMEEKIDELKMLFDEECTHVSAT